MAEGSPLEEGEVPLPPPPPAAPAEATAQPPPPAIESPALVSAPLLSIRGAAHSVSTASSATSSTTDKPFEPPFKPTHASGATSATSDGKPSQPKPPRGKFSFNLKGAAAPKTLKQLGAKRASPARGQGQGRAPEGPLLVASTSTAAAKVDLPESNGSRDSQQPSDGADANTSHPSSSRDDSTSSTSAGASKLYSQQEAFMPFVQRGLAFDDEDAVALQSLLLESQVVRTGAPAGAAGGDFLELREQEKLRLAEEKERAAAARKNEGSDEAVRPSAAAREWDQGKRPLSSPSATARKSSYGQAGRRAPPPRPLDSPPQRRDDHYGAQSGRVFDDSYGRASLSQRPWGANGGGPHGDRWPVSEGRPRGGRRGGREGGRPGDGNFGGGQGSYDDRGYRDRRGPRRRSHGEEERRPQADRRRQDDHFQGEHPRSRSRSRSRSPERKRLREDRSRSPRGYGGQQRHDSSGSPSPRRRSSSLPRRSRSPPAARRHCSRSRSPEPRRSAAPFVPAAVQLPPRPSVAVPGASIEPPNKAAEAAESLVEEAGTPPLPSSTNRLDNLSVYESEAQPPPSDVLQSSRRPVETSRNAPPRYGAAPPTFPFDRDHRPSQPAPAYFSAPPLPSGPPPPPPPPGLPPPLSAPNGHSSIPRIVPSSFDGSVGAGDEADTGRPLTPHAPEHPAVLSRRPSLSRSQIATPASGRSPRDSSRAHDDDDEEGEIVFEETPEPRRRTKLPERLEADPWLLSAEEVAARRLEQAHEVDEEMPLAAELEAEEDPLERTFVGSSHIKDYTLQEKLGEGTFGVVWKGVKGQIDGVPEEEVKRIEQQEEELVERGLKVRRGDVVALKQIILHNEGDGMPITSLREIRILKSLDHPNVVPVVDIALEPGDSMTHAPGKTFMVFPYMDHDLAGLLENAQVRLLPEHIKQYARQLLQGTHYLHENGILHRDMKAANLLISNAGFLMIADFGLARSVERAENGCGYTNCVVTRWYRPPELLLGEVRYHLPVDMWGVGCVIAEMFAKKPIFPGESDLNQAHVIFRTCGSPNDSTWPGWRMLPEAKNTDWFNNPRTIRADALRWSSDDKLFADLIDKILVLDPKKRLTASEALDHDWFWTHPFPKEPSQMPQYKSSHEYDKRKQEEERPIRHIPPVFPPQQPLYPHPPVQQQHGPPLNAGGYGHAYGAPPPGNRPYGQQQPYPAHQQQRPYGGGPPGRGGPPPGREQYAPQRATFMKDQPPGPAGAGSKKVSMIEMLNGPPKPSGGRR